MSTSGNTGHTPHHEPGMAAEIRHYAIGLAAALILTLASFGVVAYGLMSPAWAVGILAVLALVQVVVHFHYFLHIDLKASSRDDLQLILFTSLIILLMVGGSLWVLGDLYTRM